MFEVKKIVELYFGQQQPEDIQRNFFIWLKRPILFKEKEEALSMIWNELSVIQDSETGKSFHNVEKRLGMLEQQLRRKFFLRLTRIAAIFIIPVISLLSAWLYVQNQTPAEINIAEYFVANGEIGFIELPDKSQIIVNSGSTLFYQKDFNGKTREIYLNGEAKFIIVKDSKRPFKVITNDMSVEALGTVFNVSSYSDNQTTAASLIEGIIKVNIKSTEESFILNPYEQIVYDKISGQQEKVHANIDYVLAWEKGQMVFQSTSLQTIIKELERRHNVSVYLNTANFKDEKLTVKFLYDESLEEILRTLQQIIIGFRYKIVGDKIFIY